MKQSPLEPFRIAFISIVQNIASILNTIQQLRTVGPFGTTWSDDEMHATVNHCIEGILGSD